MTGISRLFAVAGDAPFNVMLYGTGFTPTTTAFVAGFSRAATVIDSNHIRVPLTAADLATAGELRISAGNTDAAGTCRILSASGLAVQERGYAWPATTPVVEFYNAALDHYFVTANPDEMAKLDDGTFKGWARTQQSFKAFPADHRRCRARSPAPCAGSTAIRTPASTRTSTRRRRKSATT